MSQTSVLLVTAVMMRLMIVKMTSAVVDSAVFQTLARLNKSTIFKTKVTFYTEYNVHFSVLKSVTPRQHRTPAGNRGPLPPGGSALRRAGSTSHQLQGPLIELQGSRLQELQPGQRILLPRQHRTRPLLVPSPLCSPGAKVYAALRLSPAEEANVADITGGTFLCYIDRPPLHYRQT
jgi:hypothetical protein